MVDFMNMPEPQQVTTDGESRDQFPPLPVQIFGFRADAIGGGEPEPGGGGFDAPTEGQLWPLALPLVN